MSCAVQIIKDDLLKTGLPLGAFSEGPLHTNEKIHYGGVGQYTPFEMAIGDGPMGNHTDRSFSRFNDLDDFLPHLVKHLEELPATFPPTDILETHEYREVKAHVLEHLGTWGRPFCPF